MKHHHSRILLGLSANWASLQRQNDITAAATVSKLLNATYK